jgi:hypothetical protein
MTNDPNWSQHPEPYRANGPTWPSAATPARTPWYRQLRFMLPIVGFGGLVVGSAAASAGASSQSTAIPTVTTTVSAAPTTVTSTAAAKSVAPKATTPPVVQAVLKAWTEAGPQPDKQHAAMAQLKRDWPTLAEALEKATGVKAPAGAAPAPKPAPVGPTIPGDGTFAVGSDIPAGTYRSPKPDSGNCYWQRSKDDSDSLNSIIANDNTAGPARVTLHRGEYFKDSGCNDWVKAA